MRFLAAFVDEIFCQIQIFLISSRFRKFYEGEFNFLMARIAMLLVWPGAEDGGDVVGIAAEDVHHFPFACSLIIGDGGFDQMACAIEFMPVAEVCPSFFWFNGDKMRIQIAVWLLRLFHPVDQFVHHGFHFRVWKLRKRITDRFNQFCDIGVPENVWRIRHAGLPFEFPCIDTPRVFALAVFDWQRVFTVDGLTFLPEATCYGDVFKRKKPHDFLLLRGCLSALLFCFKWFQNGLHFGGC